MFLFRQFLPKPQHFILSFTQSRKPDYNIYILPVQTLTNRRNLSGQALSIKHPGNESLETQFCFVKHLVMKSCQKTLLKNQFAVVVFFLSLAATPGCMWSAWAFLPGSKVSGQAVVTGEDETRNMLWSPGCRIQHVKA
jgi:hypothetical protein